MFENILQINDNYSFQTRHFVNWLIKTKKDFNEDSIKEYFEFLNNSNYKASTIKNKRSAVCKRFKQVNKNKDLNERLKQNISIKDICEDVKPPLIFHKISMDKILSPVEYRKLLERCKSKRQKAFIRFLWDTGCRVSEMIGVRLDRCEISENIVKIRILGKGNKERFVRIRRELFDYCREIFNGKEYLFETSSGSKYCRDYISHQIKKQGLKIKRNISAHSLRHSFASRKISEFPNKISAISEYMGHVDSYYTLDWYCHNELSDEDLF